jgi:hypothetical protein
MEPFQSIEEWRIREFEKNIYIKAQQADARLFGHAEQGTQHSKLKSYEIMGSTSMVERKDRFGDTPNIDVGHERRSVMLKEYEWGKLVDDLDLLKTLADPTNSYTALMAKAVQRTKDQVFISAATGSALEGEDATSTVAFPTAQQICSTTGAAYAPFNLNTLLMLKEMFDRSEIAEEERMISFNANTLRGLLNTTEVKNADYNSVKALVNGQLNSFMGFNFVRTELIAQSAATDGFGTTFAVDGTYAGGGALTATAGSNVAIAWVKSGVRVMTGKDMSVQITPRADKRNIPQIYGWMSLGGMRMEDIKVIRVVSKLVA